MTDRTFLPSLRNTLNSPDKGIPYSPITSMERAEKMAGFSPEHSRSTSYTAYNGPEDVTRPFHERQASWDRFKGKTREPVGVFASLKAIATSSLLNILLVFVPFSWVGHFLHWNKNLVFAFSYLAIISLQRLFEFGGEQMSLYCGKDLGDLIQVTLGNAVEATLAIILLTKCELKLLQSSVAGVVLLRLLFVPGVSFLTGGVRVFHQDLHPLSTELNHTLLTLGVLSLLIPAAFFSALNPGFFINTALASEATNSTTPISQTSQNFINDTLRKHLLKISRGAAIILLIVYVCSRIYLHNPPQEGNPQNRPEVPEELQQLELKLADEKPKVNVWVCICMLIVTVGVMAVTAEWLVTRIESVRETAHITREFFGVILLPLVSYSGDATVAVIYFIKSNFIRDPEPPTSLAKGRAIDLSVQFLLFWMPFVVLLGWWTDKPLSLLFDILEFSALIGACFLVNYVTADSKTNWAEGVSLVAFYLMIVLVVWYYQGQIEIHELLQCNGMVETLAKVVGEGEESLL